MKNGLDDVVATETMLSDVDGLGGILIIRGHSLDELAGIVTYEELLALLLADAFEDKLDAGTLRREISLARQDVFRALPDAGAPLLRLPVTDAVRALTAQFEDGDDLATALRLIAAPAVFTPAVIRLKQGKAAVAPDPALGHAADILHMLHDRSISAGEAAALDTYLVTVSDHGMNASTFAARVVASTHAGLVSSVLAAFGALKGPLHGGAPGPVLDMLDAIGTPENAESWLEKALDNGERLMGFGHRIYRVRDPRADALMQALRRLAGSGDHGAGRFKLAESVEAAALRILARRKPDRPLKTNVEFYTALLLETLGFPRESFTSVFAMGRVGGWIAHAREQTQHGRLIRPQSRYTGPRPIKAA